MSSGPYAYDLGGHVKRIVRQYPQSSEPDKFYVTCLGIDMNQHFWLVRKMECEADAQGEATDVVTTFAREFRYDGDRQRYLIRDRDPNNLLLPVREYWRDYLGNDIHVDYEVGLGDPQDPNIIPGNRYTHGYGLFHVDTPTGEQYLHADMLGSTQLVTDGAGNVVDSAFYTAFGEVLAGDLDIRYGYCGAWGYQTDGFEDPSADIGLLHFGAAGGTVVGSNGLAMTMMQLERIHQGLLTQIFIQCFPHLN